LSNGSGLYQCLFAEGVRLPDADCGELLVAGPELSVKGCFQVLAGSGVVASQDPFYPR